MLHVVAFLAGMLAGGTVTRSMTSSRMVHCRDCESWSRGQCFKHAFSIVNEYGDEFDEGIIQTDGMDFCSFGTRRRTDAEGE